MSQGTAGRNWTIGKKLTTGYGVMLLVALGLGISGLYSVRSLSGELDTAVNKTAKKILMLDELQVTLVTVRYDLRGALLYAMHNQMDTAEKNERDFSDKCARLRQLLADIRPMVVTERGLADMANLEKQVELMQSSAEPSFAAANAGRHKEALELAVAGFVKAYESASQSATDFMQAQPGLMQSASAQAAQTSMRASAILWILLALALVVAPVLYFIVDRTSRQLRTVASDLADGARQIASASAQVAASSQSLAQGASEQAASLEETSASSEEITSMTRKNAENSQSSASMMDDVDRRLGEGNQTLERVISSMRDINESSGKISKIIKVIDDIAFQTNILALNAAVEAARAGEAGMGFAVVADEVRNLAQRSAQAAKDTATLIEESIANSKAGSDQLQQVAGVIHAISDSAASVRTLVDEVNLGSQEQAKGIEQIAKAVAQMDHVTQTTAATAEESASASEELSAQAEALKQIVMQLHGLVGGQSRE